MESEQKMQSGCNAIKPNANKPKLDKKGGGGGGDGVQFIWDKTEFNFGRIQSEEYHYNC